MRDNGNNHSAAYALQVAEFAKLVSDSVRLATWPLPPAVMYFEQWPIRHPALLFGGLALHEPKYIELWKRLDPAPSSSEVAADSNISFGVRA